MIVYPCLGCGKPDLPIEALRCPKCGEENFIPLNRTLSASESRPEPINDTKKFCNASTEQIGEANTAMTDCSSNQHEQTELLMKDISFSNEEPVDGFEKTNVEVERDGGAETTTLRCQNTGLTQEPQLPTRSFDPVLKNSALQDIPSAYDRAYFLNGDGDDVCDSAGINSSATVSAHGEEPENRMNSSHQPQIYWENQPSIEMAASVDEWSQFKNEDGKIDFAGCRRCLAQFCDGQLSFDGDSKPYKCDKCLCRFDQRSLLKKHLVVHSKERPFKCGQCHFTSKRKGDRDEHILNVHTKRENKSSAEVASGVDELSQFKNEEGEIEFAGCNKCSRKFCKGELSFNGDPKAYKCEKCLCSFSAHYDLKRHLAVHSKDRPFECGQCVYTCKRKKGLVSHNLIFHTKQ